MPMLVFRSGNMARRCITHNHSGGKSRERTARISHLINFFTKINMSQKKQISNWFIWNISCHNVMITWRNKQPFWCCLTVWISLKKIPDLEILTLENSFKLSAIYSSSPCWALPPFCFRLWPSAACAGRGNDQCSSQEGLANLSGQAKITIYFTIIREDAWDLVFLILGDDYEQQPRRIGQSVRLSQYQILLHVFLHNTSETDVSF